MGYLKSVWDMVAVVMHTFGEWHATPWDKINVDMLVEETKKLAKEVKTLNKAVRGYEVFRWASLYSNNPQTVFILAIRKSYTLTPIP